MFAASSMKIFVVSVFTFLFMSSLAAQEIVPLYKAAIPGNKPVPNIESSDTDGILRISHISVPAMQVFLPAKDIANGTAVLICPGGGYSINAYGHEGVDIAKKFNEMGVAAFVLKYRLPDDAVMTNKTTAPLQDAQQATRMIRDNAAKWNIKTNRIGIIGFSAGGHLASTAGTHFDKPQVENSSGTSLRPDFMILIYPVISFDSTIAHMGSRENLLGKNAPEQLVKLYSNELQVTAATPPTFLLHASDDDVVNVLNSTRFYEALIKNKVPAEMHIYQHGGHGFGLNNRSTGDYWMDRCAAWMKANGWLSK